MRGYRRRQILKLRDLSKEERWELTHDYHITGYIKCPICNGKLYTNRWYEEYHGCVETIEKCGCGYLNHWSYGVTWLNVGKWEMDFDYTLSDELVKKVWDEFDRQIQKQKQKMKRIMKRIYKNR